MREKNSTAIGFRSHVLVVIGEPFVRAGILHGRHRRVLDPISRSKFLRSFLAAFCKQIVVLGSVSSLFGRAAEQVLFLRERDISLDQTLVA